MRNDAASAMSPRIKDRFCIQSRWSRLNRAKPSLSHDVLALVVVGEDHICGQRIIAIADGRREKQRDHYLRHSICRDRVSGAECVTSKAVTYRTLRDNDGRLRRMIRQPCPQNDNVSIANVCHVPPSTHLGSWLITTARLCPEGLLVIKDKARVARNLAASHLIGAKPHLSTVPSAPTMATIATAIFCQCSASAAGTFQVSGSNQSTVAQNVPSAKVGTRRPEKLERDQRRKLSH